MSNYNYTNVEIITHTKKIKEYLTNNDNVVMSVESVHKIITSGDKSKLIKNTIVINAILTKNNLHTLISDEQFLVRILRLKHNKPDNVNRPVTSKNVQLLF